MKYIFIGDVHGKTTECLVPLLARRGQDANYILQVGDMGLGFQGVNLPPQPACFGFIRGNHDNPGLCQSHSNYAGEYGPWNGVFVVGGAFSIDWQWRVPGKSWWFGEELSAEEGQKAYEAYAKQKPRIVATHDCPQEIGEQLLRDGGFRPEKWGSTESRTAKLLQAMWDIHKPEYWVFGHYHRSWTIDIRGTKFRCLNELEVAQLEVKDVE
jgi:hypothetical protein